MSKFSCEVARGSAHLRDDGLELQLHYRHRVLVIVHNLGSGFTHTLGPCARSCLYSIPSLTYQLSIAAQPTDRTFNTAINRSISKLCRLKLDPLPLTHSRCRFSLRYPRRFATRCTDTCSNAKIQFYFIMRMLFICHVGTWRITTVAYSNTMTYMRLKLELTKSFGLTCTRDSASCYPAAKYIRKPLGSCTAETRLSSPGF